MKRVKFKTEDPEVIEFDDFDDLLNSAYYIGFTPKGLNAKYIVVMHGEGKGLAISMFGGTWTDRKDQRTAEGQYFVFNDGREFLEWFFDQ